jgi:hypothetical protein
MGMELFGAALKAETEELVSQYSDLRYANVAPGQ